MRVVSEESPCPGELVSNFPSDLDTNCGLSTMAKVPADGIYLQRTCCTACDIWAWGNIEPNDIFLDSACNGEQKHVLLIWGCGGNISSENYGKFQSPFFQTLTACRLWEQRSSGEKIDPPAHLVKG